MRRGRRYDTEPKLNIKKVLAVIIAILVLIMFVFVIRTLLKRDQDVYRIETISYYTVYTNEKWGVIDSKGNIVIEPTYSEMIVIPNSKEDIFICTYDINYENGSYKTKVLNSKNEELFKEYDIVEYIANYDISNNLWYEKNILKVQKDGKFGLINFDGKVLVNPEYESINALTGIENSILIKNENGVGVCDIEGKIQVEPIYTEIKALSDNYKDGYIVKNADGKYGVVDFTKNIILEDRYEEIKQIYNDGKYIVKEDGKYKLMDRDSKILLEEKAENIIEIAGEKLIIQEKSLYGLIDIQGNTILETEYEDLKWAFSNYYIAKKGGKYGIVNSDKEVKIDFSYDDITYRKEGIIEASSNNSLENDLYNNIFELKLKGIISDIESEKGYMRVRTTNEYNYYNFKFEKQEAKQVLEENTLFLSKKDGKYGYVDKENNIVVDYIYEDALEQNISGFAAVKKDGVWGAIDEQGNIVIEPKYKMENNIIIDFISRWHLSEDLNAYYYTDI